jgi:hypothetical protein
MAIDVSLGRLLNYYYPDGCPDSEMPRVEFEAKWQATPSSHTNARISLIKDLFRTIRSKVIMIHPVEKLLEVLFAKDVLCDEYESDEEGPLHLYLLAPYAPPEDAPLKQKELEAFFDDSEAPGISVSSLA